MDNKMSALDASGVPCGHSCLHKVYNVFRDLNAEGRLCAGVEAGGITPISVGSVRAWKQVGTAAPVGSMRAWKQEKLTLNSRLCAGVEAGENLPIRVGSVRAWKQESCKDAAVGSVWAWKQG